MTTTVFVSTHRRVDSPRPVIAYATEIGRVSWIIKDEADTPSVHNGAYLAGRVRLPADRTQAETEAGWVQARTEARKALVIVHERVLTWQERRVLSAACGMGNLASKREWLPAVESLLAKGLIEPDPETPVIYVKGTVLGNEACLCNRPWKQ